MANRSVKYSLIADLRGFTPQIEQASASVKKLGNDLTSMEPSAVKTRAALTTVGDAAGKMGLVAAAGLGASVKAAMDWESAWTGVLKTVDGTPAQLSKLEEGLRSLAVETGFAHGEVAAVAEAAGQLGISTGGIEAFTSVMLDMGVSTSLSAEEAATGLARLRNIMGGTEAEIRNTGSAMVELGNNFATTEGEILAMSMRVAGAGRQAGLTTSDVLGLSAAMSSVGIEAEAGGSAISLTMKRIGSEVETNGAKLEMFARVSGMSAEEFKAAWEDDAAGALTAFVAGLGDAERLGMSTNAVLRELGITGIREADSLLRLSSNAEMLGEALGVSAEGFRENKALAEEAGKFYGTSAQQVAQAWAQIKDAAIDVGSVILPVVSEVAGAVGALAKGFQALPGPVKDATGGLMGLAAIAGGSIWAFSKIVQTATDMRGAFTDLGVNMEGVNKRALAMRGGAAVAGGALLMLSSHADDANESLGSLSRVGGSALLGFAAGGPIGAALGAGAGLLGELAAGAKDVKSAIAGIDEAIKASDMDALAESQERMLEGYGRQTGIMAGLSATIPGLSAAYDKFAVDQDGVGEATERANAALVQARIEAGEYAGLGNVVASASSLVARAMRDAKGEALGVGGALSDASGQAHTFKSAMEALGAVLEGRADMRTYQASLDELTATLKRNGKNFNIATAAGRENQAALDGVASSAIKTAEGLKGMERRRFLEGTIGQIRTLGQQFGVPKRETNALIALLEEAGRKKVRPKVTVDADVSAAVRAKRLLDSIVSKTVRVTTLHETVRGGERRAYADGGRVVGPGTGTSDSIPALVSNGEYVIKAKAVDHYGPALFDRLNAMRFADGGLVGNRWRESSSAFTGQVSRVEAFGSSAQVAGLRAEVAALRADLAGFERARAGRAAVHAETTGRAAAEGMKRGGNAVAARRRRDV